MTPLTPKQAQAKNFIRSYTVQHGYAPSIREMATGLGLSASAVGTVHSIINRLEERGHIRRLRGQSRSIEVVDNIHCPNCGHDLSSSPEVADA